LVPPIRILRLLAVVRDGAQTDPTGDDNVVKERILITVRTYPTFSKQYIETVCTGGINDQCEWRRLYPVSLRYEDEAKQYRTFDIVEVNLRDGTDGRQESKRPDMGTMRITGHLDDWQARCDWVNPTILQSISAMTAANRSLAAVAVKQVLEFIADPAAADWSPEQKEQLKQSLMFGERLELEKIPFDFRLRWQDQDGQEHKSLILAWEMYQTWRSYKQQYSDPVDKMRDVFMNNIFGSTRQLSLFMGNHSRFRDVWMVCGWFHPPKEVAANVSLFGN
jgi:hypothetical protein